MIFDRGDLTAKTICQETLLLLNRARTSGTRIWAPNSTRFRPGKIFSNNCQWSTVFGLERGWEELSIDSFDREYLTEAILTLALQIPENPDRKGKELENPKGVISSSVEGFSNLQARVIIMLLPVDYPDIPVVQNYSLQDYYNINYDETEKRLCGLFCRLDVIFR